MKRDRSLDSKAVVPAKNPKYDPSAKPPVGDGKKPGKKKTAALKK